MKGVIEREVEENEEIQVLYDGKCPLCTGFCTSLQKGVSNDAVPLRIVNARDEDVLVDEATAQGFDLDKGMVVKIGDEFYHGAAAMVELAKRSRGRERDMGRGGWWSRFVARHFFSSARRAALFYPLARSFRGGLLRLLNIDDIHNLQAPNVLKKQLGKAAWQRLDKNIQARFDNELCLDEDITYEGHMKIMERSRMGAIFAYLTKIIGNPLTPYQGIDIPMEVKLFKLPYRNGTYWKRTYFFPDKKAYSVTSSKQESKKGEMLEVLRGGFGMKLDVYEENAALHFKSTRYFWRFLKVRWQIPHWLSPGQTHVIHTDLGGGYFSFEIKMQHKQLGQTFHQYGEFKAKSSANDLSHHAA